MGRYIVRRLLQMIPMLLVMSALYFVLVNLAGDPLAGYIQGNPKIRGEDIKRLQHELGLDQPMAVRYFKWLGKAVSLDWGYSLSTKREVTTTIFERIPATLELTIVAEFFALLIGLSVGIYSAVKRYTLPDYIATFTAFFGISVPVFWMGIVLQIIFGVQLHWLPTAGRESVGEDFNLADRIRHIILPATVLTFVTMAGWTRYMRAELLNVINADYIRTARAKGLSEMTVVFRHAVRNALIPVVTLMALTIPGLIAGAIVTETVFAWPGMGRLFYQSVTSSDFPVILMNLMMTSFLVLLFNIIRDVVYAYLDPRIRFS